MALHAYDPAMTGRLGGRRAWLGYLSAGLVAICCYYAIPARNAGSLAHTLVYCVASGSAAVAIGYALLGHRVRPRLPWLLLGLSQGVYALADCTFYVSHNLLGSTIYPSIADIFYILHYPLQVLGLVILIRYRARGRDLSAVLDAAMLAVVAAMLSWLYLMSPQTRLEAPTLATVASVAYPVMDLALLAVGMRLVLGPGRRPAAFVLLVANLTAILLADTLYVQQQLSGTYHTGNFLDAIWLAGNIAIGAAALHPTAGRVAERADRADSHPGPGRIVALCLTALVAPAVMLIQYLRHRPEQLPLMAVVCAVLFILVIARMAGLVADQRRLAVTDALTGLYTRRFVESRLPAEISRAEHNDAPLAVFIVDVDHFKSINDRFGHPAGDRALCTIASRLRDVTRPGDVLARYGGEEFAMLAPDVTAADLPRMAERLRRCVGDAPITLSEQARVAVTVSVGTASFPLHGRCPRTLVEIADRALYAAKALGRDSVVVGDAFEPHSMVGDEQSAMIEYLCRLADEVDGHLSACEHSRAIGRWAALVAAELGYDTESSRCAALAGRLHDIGKIVVPASILSKPSALTDEEWLLLRQHPEHGFRLANAVPGLVGPAQVIRQHHERCDGTGYPLGLTRTAIRAEARILAVCDSWAAMRSDRPYQVPYDAEKARQELLSGRGSQFDPDVVAAFLALHDRGLVGELEPLRLPNRTSVPLPSPDRIAH